ncbi:hypothetical protein HDU81_007281 [Chytriomyces hyalinus]|nr:hypothetical protein HDU81_007281 [Chytriomyces hyalinus]
MLLSLPTLVVLLGPVVSVAADCAPGSIKCGPHCIDPVENLYHCVQTPSGPVLAQGPPWDPSLPLAPMLDSGTTELGSGPRKFTLINKCKSEVWPALQGAGGTTPPFNGGIPGLKSGQKVTLRLPNPFLSGRIWPRTDCRQGADGKINCLTGDCEYGVECGGLSNRIPATLLEFSLDASGGKDYYDLSLVDGYSIGLGLQVSGGSKVGDPSLPPGFDCGSPVCNMDVSKCPKELKSSDPTNPDRPVLCYNINAAVNDDMQRAMNPSLQKYFDDADMKSLLGCSCPACGAGQGCGEGCSDTGYCCSIMDLRRNGTDPNTPPSQQGHGKVCLASSWPAPLDPGYQDIQYDKVFKNQCPDAYSWQFDDESSLFQCVGAEYELTFCPDSPSSDVRTDLEEEDAIDLTDLLDALKRDFDFSVNADGTMRESFFDDLSAYVSDVVIDKPIGPLEMQRLYLYGNVVMLDKMHAWLSSRMRSEGLQDSADLYNRELCNSVLRSYSDCYTCDNKQCPSSVKTEISRAGVAQHYYTYKPIPSKQSRIVEMVNKVGLEWADVKDGSCVVSSMHLKNVPQLNKITKHNHFSTHAYELWQKTIADHSTLIGIRAMVNSSAIPSGWTCMNKKKEVECPSSIEERWTPDYNVKWIPKDADKMAVEMSLATGIDFSYMEKGSYRATHYDTIYCKYSHPKPGDEGVMDHCEQDGTSYYEWTDIYQPNSDYPPSMKGPIDNFFESTDVMTATMEKIARNNRVTFDEVTTSIDTVLQSLSSADSLMTQVSQYEETVEKALTAEDAAKHWGLHVFLMVVELVAAVVLPELLVGAIAAGIAAFAETVSAISTIATIGGRVAQAFKDLMQAIKSGVEGSALVARSRTFMAALLKDPPAWLVKLKTKVSKGWTKMRSTAKCLFTEEVISGLLPEPLGGGGLIGRDDYTVQELALMEPIITASISNSSVVLERRAGNDEHCILKSDQTTAYWRDSSDTFRTNCDTSPQRVICVTQGLVTGVDPRLDLDKFYTEYDDIQQCPEYRRFIVGEDRITKWIPDGNVPDGETGAWDGRQLKKMCPGDPIKSEPLKTYGRVVECDHKLELQEFRNVFMKDLGGFTADEVKQWCKDNRGLNDAIKEKLNSRGNLVYVDRDVNQAKGKMVVDPPSDMAMRGLPQYKTKQTTLALDRYLEVVADDRRTIARELNVIVRNWMAALPSNQLNEKVKQTAADMEDKVAANTHRMRTDAMTFHRETYRTAVNQRFQTAREETVDSSLLDKPTPVRKRNAPEKFCDVDFSCKKQCS